jgi:MFS family permease
MQGYRPVDNPGAVRSAVRAEMGGRALRDASLGRAEAPRWREVFEGARGRLTAGLLLLEAVVAVEALVVTTIMPDVRRDLGHIELYGLAFSASALATFASIPIAGRAADRYGPARVLSVMLAVFSSGLLIAGVAPAMPVLIVGRLFQGAGAGSLYAVSLATVARSFPDRLRPRVLALLASMWIVPGLIGPSIGALFASTVGWRWAFAAPGPVLVVAWVLVAPALRGMRGSAAARARVPIRAPIQLMVGMGMFLTGLTLISPIGLGLVVAGVAIAVPALTHVIPSGTIRARQGLPAAAAAAFLLSAAFFGVDSFITLMLTGLRGMSIAAASIVVTTATVTWSAGSFWQSSRAERTSSGRLVTIGAVLIVAGTVAVAAGLLAATPVTVVFVGWGLAGIGMGIAFPTIPLSVMREASEESQAGELSSTLLMDTLGVAVGAGVGGGCIALSRALDAGIRPGIAGAYAIGLAAAIALLLVVRRIPSTTASRDA